VNNLRAGTCEDCGRYWAVTSGGLNDDGQCMECERRLPVQHNDARYQQANDYEMPIEDELAKAGAGLGV